MEAFQWDECFVTGVAMVDDQHHQLINTMNRFGEAVMQAVEPTQAEFDHVFGEMEDYAKYHFQEEEAMMHALGLDARHVKHHCSEHAHFLKNVTRMHVATVNSDPAGASELLTYLTNWLAYHILGTDQTMALLVSAVEQGKSQREAYLAGQQARDPATAILLRSMTTLFNQCNESHRALIEMNQTLEARVADRTSDLVTLNQQLETLALTDVLTGLPNRRYALRCLESLWQESTQNQTSLTCMMIDADGFKAINDGFGHEAGDCVLRQLARSLKNSVRNDDVVCRLGGDEFLILCNQTTLAGGLVIAEKLRQEVASLSAPAGTGVWQGSVSVGVTQRTESMLDFDALLKLADQSVYLAKKNGRNCIATVQDI